MTDPLHYSPTALLRRSGGTIVVAAVVLGDYVVHADGGFPQVFGLGVVPSAAIVATALYLVAATIVMTLALMRRGGTALAADGSGVTVHTAWFSKTLPWTDLAGVALDVRYTRYSRYTVVAVREASGLFRCHTVDTRLLAETLDAVDAWAGAAERVRIAHGGAPYVVPTSGLAGYDARLHASDLAADLAAARGGAMRPSTVA